MEPTDIPFRIDENLAKSYEVAEALANKLPVDDKTLREARFDPFLVHLLEDNNP